MALACALIGPDCRHGNRRTIGILVMSYCACIACWRAVP